MKSISQNHTQVITQLDSGLHSSLLCMKTLQYMQEKEWKLWLLSK